MFLNLYNYNALMGRKQETSKSLVGMRIKSAKWHCGHHTPIKKKVVNHDIWMISG